MILMQFKIILKKIILKTWIFPHLFSQPEAGEGNYVQGE